MDEKDWQDDPEFWDTEDHEDDDDDYNGLDDNVDAKNDETFDNAAEWNEDEHEELIARDMILSHATGRRSDRNNRNSTNNSSNNHSQANDRQLNRSERSTETSRSRNLIDFRNVTANSTSSSNYNSNKNNNNEPRYFAMLTQALEPTRTTHNSSWNTPLQSQAAESLFALNRDKPSSSTSGSTMTWQDALGTSQRLQILQLQQQAQEKLRMLSQTRLLQEQEQERLKVSQANELRKLLQQRQQDQQHQLQMQQHQRNLQAQHIGTNPAYIQSEFFNEKLAAPRPTVSQPQVMTVDELERQLMKTNIGQSVPQQPAVAVPRLPADVSRRAGWSPFGSKDLFKTDDPAANIPVNLLDPNLFRNFQPQSMTLEQQERLFLHQQQLLLQHQQLQQLALYNQQQQQQQQQNQQQRQQEQQQIQQKQQLESRLVPPNAKCFTVEELERQMLAGRPSNVKTQDDESNIKPSSARDPIVEKSTQRSSEAAPRQPDKTRDRNAHDRRNGERQDRYARHDRDTTDHRGHHKERRDHRNNGDNHRNRREEPTIVPPQVQLSVIDKAKLRHSITVMHQDEIIRDRMPSSGEGFRYLRQSEVSASKEKHNGVLTDKERDWLTRIQEKIQADYDNNLDQDYYYLLYFNRSSMADEAAQKPSGPGVLDRRFIPRERLLYNSGV